MINNNARLLVVGALSAALMSARVECLFQVQVLSLRSPSRCPRPSRKHSGLRRPRSMPTQTVQGAQVVKSLTLWRTSSVCFITAGPITKLFAWGGRRVEDMFYERRRAEACVDESAHHALCVWPTFSVSKKFPKK